MRQTGATQIIEEIIALGVRTVVGIPGGSILPLYDALYASPLQHILARHEQGAAFIAQGMARSTGQPAFCLATSGPGASNLLTGLADAWRDSIPIIAITGQVPRHLQGSQAFQEIDIISMAQACTKAAFSIQSLEEITQIIPKAWALASQGRPGPILIDIPKDIMTQEYPQEIEKSNPIHQACQMITQAQRPLFYIGGGIIHSQASMELRQLIEASGIPVLSTLMGLGAIASNHPLFLGMLGMHGHPLANMALTHTDLLIVVGARFDDRATGELSKFAPLARVIHLDLDPSELNRLRQAQCTIFGDARPILKQIRQNLALRADQFRPWIQELEILRTQNPLPIQEAHHWIRQIAQISDSNSFVCTDVGQHQMWVAQSFPLSFARQFLSSGGLGTMGFGLPAAIGAAIAHPKSTVLCFSGDGSIMMNIQELATLSELGLKVKICLFDNSGLGMVRQQQKLFFDERYSACDYHKAVDWASLAQGFDIPFINPRDLDEPLLQTILQQDGPALIHIPLAPAELVWPHVPTGQSNCQMLISCP